MHKKKILAPVIITLAIVAAYVAYFVIALLFSFSVVISVIVGILCLGLASVMVYVLIERINEIRSGEEDDISKY